MMYGLLNERRIMATPNAHALCPGCGGDLIPKCGPIVVHHWAHKSMVDCDPWYEGESQWHRDWKMRFPEAWREVRMGPHRADVRTAKGVVVEFQRSHLSVDDILAREAFYGADKMIWVFDVTDAAEAERLVINEKDGYQTFRWAHYRKSIAATKAFVFLDLGEQLFHLRKLYTDNTPVRGWGNLLEISEFTYILTKQEPASGNNYEPSLMQ